MELDRERRREWRVEMEALEERREKADRLETLRWVRGGLWKRCEVVEE